MFLKIIGYALSAWLSICLFVVVSNATFRIEKLLTGRVPVGCSPSDILPCILDLSSSVCILLSIIVAYAYARMK